MRPNITGRYGIAVPPKLGRRGKKTGDEKMRDRTLRVEGVFFPLFTAVFLGTFALALHSAPSFVPIFVLLTYGLFLLHMPKRITPWGFALFDLSCSLVFLFLHLETPVLFVNAVLLWGYRQKGRMEEKRKALFPWMIALFVGFAFLQIALRAVFV